VLTLRSIGPPINQKKAAGKNYCSGFPRSFTVLVSPSGIYGALLQPLMLLTKTAKKKTLFAGIRIYSRGIAGFTEQRTAFMRAQSAILQGRTTRVKNSLSTKLISQKLIR